MVGNLNGLTYFSLFINSFILFNAELRLHETIRDALPWKRIFIANPSIMMTAANNYFLSALPQFDCSLLLSVQLHFMKTLTCDAVNQSNY